MGGTGNGASILLMVVSKPIFSLCFLVPAVQNPNLVLYSISLAQDTLDSRKPPWMERAADHWYNKHNTSKHPKKGTSPDAALTLSLTLSKSQFLNEPQFSHQHLRRSEGSSLRNPSKPLIPWFNTPHEEIDSYLAFSEPRAIKNLALWCEKVAQRS